MLETKDACHIVLEWAGTRSFLFDTFVRDYVRDVGAIQNARYSRRFNGIFSNPFTFLFSFFKLLANIGKLGLTRDDL